MMKEEFERIAGYEVSDYDYSNIIEPMYMAVSLSKSEFVRTLDKKRFKLKSKKELISEMKRLATQLKNTCIHYTDTDTQERLNVLFEEYQRRFDRSARIVECTLWSCYYPQRLISSVNETIYLVS